MKQDSQDLLQINQDLHWAFQYIGTPWVNGGRGPDSYDCWGFFCAIQKNHFNVEVPTYEVNANDFRRVATAIMDADERSRWDAVKIPNEGCAVLMAHSKYPSHVGVWLDVDGGGVLHCTRGEGVVFSTVSSLKTCGWGRVEYYKHVSNT
jgi:cell wall-associated NlpC family hydrolase